VWGSVGWIHVVQDQIRWWVILNTVVKLLVP
jgi:hypothetical protein